MDDDSQLQAELEHKVKEMASICDRMFIDAATNISNAQARYKQDYDKKQNPNEVFVEDLQRTIPRYHMCDATANTCIYSHRGNFVLALQFCCTIANAILKKVTRCNQSGLVHTALSKAWEKAAIA